MTLKEIRCVKHLVESAREIGPCILRDLPSNIALFSAVARHTMHAIEDYYCESKQ